MKVGQRDVVVTGAGSGIGAETVRRFLDQGDRVVGIDLNSEIIPKGAVAIQADVSEPADVEGLREVLSSAQILVNNAGIGSTSDPLTCTVEEWDRVFAVNARGVFLMTRAVLPGMLEAGEGVIINIASVAGMIGLPDRTAYCASKAAVISFTKQVAIQYARAGIRSNCVCPGTIDTPWVGELLDNAADPSSALEHLVARQPIGRLGMPNEVAAVIEFLASQEAAFITGSSVVVDGGMLAG